ncbi:unnamed protein product [Discula destructiva]
MNAPNIKEVKRFLIGKGLSQIIQYNDSLPETGSGFSRWQVTIVCEGGDSDPAHVPAHWHKGHDEHMQVFEGRFKLILEGKTRILTPDDGEVRIPARAIHEINGFPGEKLIFRERTSPPGDYKVSFFNDLSSGLEGRDPGLDWYRIWHTIRVCSDGDTIPTLGLHFKAIDVLVIHFLGFLAKLFIWSIPKRVGAPPRPEKMS